MWVSNQLNLAMNNLCGLKKLKKEVQRYIRQIYKKEQQTATKKINLRNRK